MSRPAPGAALLAAVAVAACSSAPQATPSPTALPSVAATPAPTPTPTPAPTPRSSVNWTYKALDEAGIGFTMPPGFRFQSAASIRAEVKQQMDSGQLPELFVELYQQELDLIDSGALLGAVSGSTSTATVSMGIVIGDAGPDLEASAEALFKLLPRIPGQVEKDRQTIQLPIGPALRITVRTDPEGGVPATGTAYVIHLTGGRALLLQGASPEGDDGFAQMIDALVMTLEEL